MEFKETKSIYLQIADRICNEILQGKYRADERIPSVREYAGIVEVNANTVARSFDHLQEQGIVYNKRGIGYFVASGAIETIKRLRKNIFLSEWLPEFFQQMEMLNISMIEIEKLYKQRALHSDE